MLKNISYQEYKVRKGGEGSGDFGHAGRPGEVGGSAEPDYPHLPDTRNPKLDARNAARDAERAFKQERDYFNQQEDLRKWARDNDVDLTRRYKPGDKIKWGHGFDLKTFKNDALRFLSKNAKFLDYAVLPLMVLAQIISQEINKYRVTPDWSEPSEKMTFKHKDGSSFSLHEFEKFVSSDEKTMRAETNLYGYEIAKPKSGWPDNMEKDIKDSYFKHLALIGSELVAIPKESRAKMSDEEYQSILTDATWRRVSVETGLPYKKYKK